MQILRVQEDVKVMAMGEETQSEEKFIGSIQARRQAEEDAIRFASKGPPTSGEYWCRSFSFLYFSLPLLLHRRIVPDH